VQPVNEYLVCYDIHNPRARRRACKFLRQLSPGYQKSGFEVDAATGHPINTPEEEKNRRYCHADINNFPCHPNHKVWLTLNQIKLSEI
jgi:hypothetical protein